MDYMHARYFSAHLGRFQSVDPVGGAPGWPQSWNRYAYVLGNPMKYTDPRGLFPGVLQPFDQFAGGFLSFMNFITVTDSPFLFSPGWASIPFRGPRSRNNTSPWQLGWQWLTGTGPRSQTFVDGDPMAEMLKQHRHIQRVAEEACAGTIAQEDSAPYNLSGIEGVPKYLRDYSTLATGGLTGNLAVTYLGSYNLNYSVADGIVQMNVTNTSTATSGFRPPVLGYTRQLHKKSA